jgi:hypothetical protein
MANMTGLTAGQVPAGTFGGGNYTFPNSLYVGNSLIVGQNNNTTYSLTSAGSGGSTNVFEQIGNWGGAYYWQFGDGINGTSYWNAASVAANPSGGSSSPGVGVFTVYNNNSATIQLAGAGNTYFTGGNVGIGTTSPGIAGTYVFNGGGSGSVGLYVGSATPFGQSYIEQDGPAATHLWVGENGTPVFAVLSGGTVQFADGTKQSTAWTGVLCGADYAESVDVTGDRTRYGPGDVLVADPDNPGKFLKSAEPYSTGVAGIYSTKPGVLGSKSNNPQSMSQEVPMAMLGRVPAKVSAENGAIRPGDLLVTSATLGYAMKGTDRSQMLGAVVGKALGSLDSGTGVIEVLVTLQ